MWGQGCWRASDLLGRAQWQRQGQQPYLTHRSASSTPQLHPMLRTQPIPLGIRQKLGASRTLSMPQHHTFTQSLHYLHFELQSCYALFCYALNPCSSPQGTDSVERLIKELAFASTPHTNRNTTRAPNASCLAHTHTMHTHTHARTHTHAHTHANTRTRTFHPCPTAMDSIHLHPHRKLTAPSA